MPFNDYFVFDGKKSTDYGLYMASDPNAIHPARRGELFPIPGRNGSIVREDGSYDTYTQTYDVLLDSNMISTDVYAHAREVAAWLLGSRGFCRLEDSYEPEYFRLARCAAQMGVENRLARFGRAQIPFEVQPQRYLKLGETEIGIESGEDGGIYYGTILVYGIPHGAVSAYMYSNESVVVSAGTFRDSNGNEIGQFHSDPVAIPTGTARIDCAWNVQDSNASVVLGIVDKGGNRTLIAGVTGTSPTVFNPTQFEARPLMKFVDTSGEPPAPVPQTLTNVNDTYIVDGIVQRAVWKDQEGKWYTTQPISTSGYDYAIITANSYTFLDSNGDSVGFDYGNFNNTKLIIPKSAATIRLGNDIGKTSSLSLQVAPLNPGDAAATINGTTINLDFSTHDTIYLDCDLHDAYYIDGSSANDKVSFSSTIYNYPTFPGFVPGENTVIVRDGDNLDFSIVPRWWEL